MNRVHILLSGFSKKLFCFVQAKTLCRYGCMYFLAALVLVCVDVIVMSSLFGWVISICCVGFASLDVVCDELNDCAWN